MSVKTLRKNKLEKATNKDLDEIFPQKPTDEEFKAMSDEELIDFHEKIGCIKFADRFPEREAIIRSIRRWYDEEKYRPIQNPVRITDEDRQLLKQKIAEFHATQS